MQKNVSVRVENSGNSYTFIYRGGDYNDEFRFNINSSFSLDSSDDSLFRVAILSRPFNSEVFYFPDLIITKSYISHFESTLRCRIFAHEIIPDSRIEYPKVMSQEVLLAFSGGFDSISAMSLLGERAVPVSMSFGGDFQREFDFFSGFNTKIIHSDIRAPGKGFPEGLDWRFLIAPVSLINTQQRTKFIATGSILEASDFSFTEGRDRCFSSYQALDLGPGVSYITPVMGLSEYGTTLIARRALTREDFSRSLASLASEKSFKSYRKRVLQSIVDGDSPPEIDPDIHRHLFGKGFTDDVLALYFAWKFGIDWVKRNYLRDNDFEAPKIDMGFMERYNQGYLSFDVDFNFEIESRLKNFDMLPYKEDDYISIARARDFLINYRSR
jgi:hypothetical protein